MNTKRKGPLPIVILMNLILVALLALIIVFIVSFVKEFNADDPTRPSSSVDSSLSSSADASSESSESSKPEESLQPDSSVEESSVQTSSKPEYTSAVVPESSRVLNSYFDDAVFVGDSLTEGIKLYDIMSNATVLSYTGLGLDNIYTKEVITQEDGTSVSVMNALENAAPGKIYIMMGANSIGYDKNTFSKKYGAIIDSAKQFHPDAIIYIESILPVTTTNKYKLDNQTIDEYNEVLMKLAEEKEVYYLDINSSLKNSEGALPTEASPADGMHFGATYYQKWFDYLKTHTVK